jgi:hypothetical protein
MLVFESWRVINLYVAWRAFHLWLEMPFFLKETSFKSWRTEKESWFTCHDYHIEVKKNGGRVTRKELMVFLFHSPRVIISRRAKEMHFFWSFITNHKKRWGFEKKESGQHYKLRAGSKAKNVLEERSSRLWMSQENRTEEQKEHQVGIWGPLSNLKRNDDARTRQVASGRGDQLHESSS